MTMSIIIHSPLPVVFQLFSVGERHIRTCNLPRGICNYLSFIALWGPVDNSCFIFPYPGQDKQLPSLQHSIHCHFLLFSILTAFTCQGETIYRKETKNRFRMCFTWMYIFFYFIFFIKRMRLFLFHSFYGSPVQRSYQNQINAFILLLFIYIRSAHWAGPAQFGPSLGLGFSMRSGLDFKGGHGPSMFETGQLGAGSYGPYWAWPKQGLRF